MKLTTPHLKYFAPTLLCCLAALLTASCSSDNDDTTLPEEEHDTAAPDNGRKLRTITIRQVDDDATRATLTDNDGTELIPSWKEGDKVRWANMSTINADGEGLTSGYNLEAKESKLKTYFTGTVECGAYDNLAIIYPAMADKEFGQVFGGGGNGYYYTISLSGQDGTLEKLAKDYHYVYADAHITDVTETTAKAEMKKTVSLLAVCKFSFLDENNKAININTLDISYGGMSSSGYPATGYPATARVHFWTNQMIGQDNVKATPVASNNPLTVTVSPAKEVVYVALLPTYSDPQSGSVVSGAPGERTFNFTVSGTVEENGVQVSGTFTGSAKATLNAGEYVVATGLKLKKNNN